MWRLVSHLPQSENCIVQLAVRICWEVSQSVFCVSQCVAQETAGFSTIPRFSVLILMPAPIRVLCLSWSGDRPFSWRTPSRSSLWSSTAMPNTKVRYQSMAQFPHVISWRFRFSWTEESSILEVLLISRIRSADAVRSSTELFWNEIITGCTCCEEA